MKLFSRKTTEPENIDMQIQTRQPVTAFVPSKPAVLTLEPSTQEPSDSFTFSADRAKQGLLAGAIGVTPLLGAGLHFFSGVQGQFNDDKVEANLAKVGALSNLGGTASLLGGLIFGNQVAAIAGAALLGVSGLTAAYSAAN